MVGGGGGLRRAGTFASIVYDTRIDTGHKLICRMAANLTDFSLY